MGSLTSRPKIKPQPQVMYVPTPTYTPPPTFPAPAPPTPAATTDQNSNVAETGLGNLLLRDRGRFGTILTGFRGLLVPSGSNAQRKTLLGE